MKRFDQQDILSARLKRNEIDVSAITDLGMTLARFHQSLESLPLDHPLANVNNVLADARDNFPPLESAAGSDPMLSELLSNLKQWTEAEYHRLHPLFLSRLQQGLIRRCHGDLHTNNIVCLHDRLVVFDGIEFNEELQWIDCQSEIAFLVMDLVAYQHDSMAFHLLSSYLEQTGDYHGLPILRFYQVYRALVRAKVTWLASSSATLVEADEAIQQRCRRYLDTARRLSDPGTPRLAITFGFSGSGKSTRALNWIDQHRGIRVRSDVERTRFQRQYPELEKYSAEMNTRVYRRLLEIARTALLAGIPTVADATFLRHGDRESFAQLAEELQVPFEILECRAPVKKLRQRVRRRKGDASEATVEVLERQIADHDPLTEQENKWATSV